MRAGWDLMYIGWDYEWLGYPDKALEYARKALELLPSGDQFVRQYVLRNMITALLCLGRKKEGLEVLRHSLSAHRACSDPNDIVSGARYIAQAYLSLGEARKAVELCRELLVDHPDAGKTPFQQWYLEKAELSHFSRELMHERFVDHIPQDWAWQDPFGDCS